MQETRVQSLGWEDAPGEGNGNSLQYSCLENPMDRGTWWATIHGVVRVRHNLVTKPSSDLRKAWFGSNTDLVMILALSFSITLNNTLTSSRLNFHNYKMVITFFTLWYCEKQIRIYREDNQTQHLSPNINCYRFPQVLFFSSPRCFVPQSQSFLALYISQMWWKEPWRY